MLPLDDYLAAGTTHEGAMSELRLRGSVANVLSTSDLLNSCHF